MAAQAATLLAPLSAWFVSVNRTVTEPYLDEVFHIRQAQHYCDGRFDIWDPKITTPPGLYLLSYISSPVLGCSITSLRLINAVCLVALSFVVCATYSVRRKTNKEYGLLSGLLASHSALNIVLFPPLFFFSALYYTDVASTLSVVVFYWYFLRNMSARRTKLLQASVQVLLGVISLMFRQTNIFWVAVMPAAYTLVVELDQGHWVIKESMYRRAEGFGDTTLNVAKTSWKMGVIYDPPVRDAFFEDYIRTAISIAACALKAATRPKRITNLVLALSPYLTLISLFGSFIVWNGSVVLGDKSNHVATINLPQMLYFWPFIAFFSWPLLLPQFILIPLMLLSRLAALAHFEPLLIFRRRYFLPRIRYFVAFTILACVVIHFNTIVHPFLFADNRHYHFYIFRLLLRPWWVRYLVAPIYTITTWACLETRGESISLKPMTPEVPDRKPADRPQAIRAPASEDTADPLQLHSASASSHSSLRLPDGKSTAMVSFAIVTVGTSALSLCTAPLVEPRYCIIPYIIWRMHFPLHSVEEPQDRKPKKAKSFKEIAAVYDYRVVLETIWLLLINGVTGYIFLNWTFTWPSEPGKMQRFMW